MFLQKIFSHLRQNYDQALEPYELHLHKIGLWQGKKQSV